MTTTEAHRLCRDYYNNDNPTEDETFLFTEALAYLIETTKKPEYMVELGGHYYARKDFHLARKYYELAAEYDYEIAYECLGYIWYYGRTGERDYEKAFYYYKKAAEQGNIVCQYKLADMFKNGYGVEKDYDRYKAIIKHLYPKVKDSRSVYDPVPEIFTRLARIYTEEGRIDDAIHLYFYAKDFLAQRISCNAFFGNLNIMKWLINDLYELIEFDADHFDLYDLYYLLNQPVHVTFVCNGQKQDLRAVEENGAIVICFNQKWYRTSDILLQNATINNRKLTSIYDELTDFQIIDPTNE